MSAGPRVGAPVILMAAPNGARRGKADHPALPVTIAEIVAEAAACHAAGASVLHAHIRDAEGAHVLDAGLYAELVAELAQAVPALLVQVTTEAAGRYGAAEQAALVAELGPRMVSVALREMAPEGGDMAHAARFYAMAAERGVHVQHILYSPEDAARLDRLIGDGTVPPAMACRLLVLGSYAGRPAEATEIDRYATAGFAAPWFLCAFGADEAAWVERAMARGGHARVGFENNLLLADGTRAPNTAALIAQAAESAHALGRPVAGRAEALGLLGLV